MPFAALSLCAVILAAPAPSPASHLASGPTLAIEDTMHTEVPEVLVAAPRVTLDEILDRVARGEARRDSALHDVAFTAALRLVKPAAAGRRAEMIEETVARVYKQKPDKVRSVTLRHWEKKAKKESDDDTSMNFTPGTGERIVNFAFRPEARGDFRFHIVGRELFGDHLIYRIAFEPRSLVSGDDPDGVVWVDTKDFVIVRQELSFARSPVPILLKGVDRLVIERREVDGHWVLRRVLLRCEFVVPVPTFGRAFDVAFQFDDYAINRGIAPAVFSESGAR
ncbi:MAG: hypothetical protein HYR74_07835 [Candidatus Eisenbacteria bacterium]|nr:hypothetical protein [Candidatus Eisenbacteria bacterium]